MEPTGFMSFDAEIGTCKEKQTNTSAAWAQAQ